MWFGSEYISSRPVHLRFLISMGACSVRARLLPGGEDSIMVLNSSPSGVRCAVIHVASPPLDDEKVNAALAEISVIHNTIFLESFWADLDEVMKLKDCEVSEESSAHRIVAN